jgi:hypothetical protein
MPSSSSTSLIHIQNAGISKINHLTVRCLLLASISKNAIIKIPWARNSRALVPAPNFEILRNHSDVPVQKQSCEIIMRVLVILGSIIAIEFRPFIYSSHKNSGFTKRTLHHQPCVLSQRTFKIGHWRTSMRSETNF